MMNLKTPNKIKVSVTHSFPLILVCQVLHSQMYKTQIKTREYGLPKTQPELLSKQKWVNQAQTASAIMF